MGPFLIKIKRLALGLLGTRSQGTRSLGHSVTGHSVATPFIFNKEYTCTYYYSYIFGWLLARLGFWQKHFFFLVFVQYLFLLNPKVSTRTHKVLFSNMDAFLWCQNLHLIPLFITFRNITCGVQSFFNPGARSAISATNTHKLEKPLGTSQATRIADNFFVIEPFWQNLKTTI